MRAALCRTYGPPEVVRVESVATPALGPGQVRVRVNVAAVNLPDVLIIADKYQVTVPLPFIPGSEFAGVVVERAGDVYQFDVDERVFGTSLVGAFAEEVVVSAQSLSRTPSSIGDRDAAALGVAHRTAFHVLKSAARVEHGDDLVVLGAGGGVGLACVELGALFGTRVTAVASSAEKLEVASRVGAQALVNYRENDLRNALRDLLPDGADVVVDPVGGGLSEPSMRALRWGGRFVTIGYASGEIPKIPLNLVLLKGVQVLGFQFRDFATHMPGELSDNERELMTLVGSGRVRPHVGASFKLDKVAAALRYVAEGRAIGKVLIEVGSL